MMNISHLMAILAYSKTFIVGLIPDGCRWCHTPLATPVDFIAVRTNVLVFSGRFFRFCQFGDTLLFFIFFIFGGVGWGGGWR